MAVAIIGLSPSTKDNYPDVELWGLPWDEGCWVKYDRLFEMHDLSLIEEHPDARPRGYLDRLKSLDNLYMQEDYFGNIRYPFEAVAETTGAYWNSSIAYMLALAVHEEHEDIYILGVDMKADEEYFYQRPNLEYLIGVAKGKGLRVHIPDESPVMKFYGVIYYGSNLQEYKERYGKR